MLIILEGIDKQGKTTLANFLAERYGFEIVKFSQPKKEPYLEYIEFLLNRKTPAILDRFYMGELAYGPVKRGKSEMTEWQVRNIELLLKARYSLNIYCQTSDSITQRNFEQENETYTHVQEIPKLRLLYERAMFKSHLHWKEFDYVKDRAYNRILQSVEYWRENLEPHLEKIQHLITARSIGDLFAHTLILGEECNYKLEKPQYSHVIVPFANGPSAEILFSALRNTSTPWMLSNVKKFHLDLANNILLNGIELSIPMLKKVVLLGNKAEEEYLKLGLDKTFSNYIKIPHPGFIARGGMSLYEYGQIIKNNI